LQGSNSELVKLYDFEMNPMFELEINGIPKAEKMMLPKDAILQLEEKDKIGFDLGRDWAYYNQPVPDNADAAIYRGYESNTAHLSRTKEIDRFIKKWLQLRYKAYLRNRPVSDNVTPKLIQLLDRPFCPITLSPLTHGQLGPHDWSVERLCNNAGYAWGNLIIESKQANEARGSMSYEEIEDAAKSTRATNRITPEAWKRYSTIARGPNFWCGGVKGIEPILTDVPRYIFNCPSHKLMEIAFWSCCHSSVKIRAKANRILKQYSKSDSSLKLARQLRAKIERKFNSGYLLATIFQNASCFDAFLRWYESCSFSFSQYNTFVLSEQGKFVNDNSNTARDFNLIDEWWVSTGGHLY
jgi:hypothetical protein